VGKRGDSGQQGDLVEGASTRTDSEGLSPIALAQETSRPAGWYDDPQKAGRDAGELVGRLRGLEEAVYRPPGSP